jgi:hypothetical protein
MSVLDIACLVVLANLCCFSWFLSISSLLKIVFWKLMVLLLLEYAAHPRYLRKLC